MFCECRQMRQVPFKKQKEFPRLARTHATQFEFDARSPCQCSGNEQYDVKFVEQVRAMEQRATELGMPRQLYYIFPDNPYLHAARRANTSRDVSCGAARTLTCQRFKHGPRYRGGKSTSKQPVRRRGRKAA